MTALYLSDSELRVLFHLASNRALSGSAQLSNRTWEDMNTVHRVSAESLERKGLITINQGPDARWARITDAGRAYVTPSTSE